MICAGFALEPWIKDGDRVRIIPGDSPRPGDIVLCDAGGWGDLRRVLRRGPGGALVTGLDTVPGGREPVPRERILGVASGPASAGGAGGRAIARLFPVWSRVAALLYWRRKIVAAPSFRDGAAESVRRKYADQVAGYEAMIGAPSDPDSLQTLAGLSPGSAILVAGSGAGSEALQLARQGYRVTGFDFVPAMVETGRRQARAAGLDVEFLPAEMETLDLPGRRFAAAYVTPLVYSFIARRARRIEALRRLGRHLLPGGIVLFSAHLFRTKAQRLATLLVWMRRRRHERGAELGDWHTWFLTSGGTLGASFIHLASERQVMDEARAAGFARVGRTGPAQFVAGEFAPGDAAPGQTSSAR
jgi:SAM-dependent methyltransferase